MAQRVAPPEVVQLRITRLQQHIVQYPQQAQNITAIIDFYRRGGSLPSVGHVVYAQCGRAGRGTIDEVASCLQSKGPGNVPYFDMVGQQLSNLRQCPPGTGTPVGTINPRLLQTRGQIAAVPWAEHAICHMDDVLQMHKIWAQFRLPLFLGGSDNPHIITQEILNDTGSSVQGIHRHDWNLMNVHNWAPSIMDVTYATGTTGYLDSFIGQIRIVRIDQTTGDIHALTEWLNETFVIKDACPDGQPPLLSGNAMRQALYFATAPGNNQLYISARKDGLIAQLPNTSTPSTSR